MILPTPEYDPMFANDGVPFRTKMVQYIEREFSDLLGSHTGLLRSEQGLAVLSKMYANRADSTSLTSKAA
jgi:hypothetical protein